MSTFKRSSLISCCVLIVLTSFIFSASAASETFYFNVPNPAETADGYIITPYSRPDGTLRAHLHWWTLTPIMTDVAYSTLPIVNASLRENVLNIDFNKAVTTDANVGYYLTIFFIYDGSSSTPSVSVSNKLITSTSSYHYEYSLNYPSYRFKTPTAFSGIDKFELYNNDNMNSNSFNYLFADNNAFYSQLVEINNNLLSIIQNSELSSDTIESILANTNTIINNLASLNNKTDLTNAQLSSIVSQLNDVITHFVSLLDKVDYTNEQLEEIVSQFSELLEVSYNIDNTLTNFVYYYWDEFVNVTFPLQISEIVSRLDLILRILNRSGDVEQTTVDSSKVDEFADIEQSLLNNDDADSAISDMEVSIDGEVYSFIWQLVTDILNTHPAVFGLVITILTLGFLALILNR